MSFWRFLKYERFYLYVVAVSLFILCVVWITQPRREHAGESILYALLLDLVLVCGLFLYRYMKNVQAIRALRSDDGEPLSLEAEAWCERMERLREEHLRALNEVQAKQREYHDFIVSWFHEIKTPISVIRLMQQTEVDPNSLREELSRIEHYVDQALYYAKLDSFHQDYEIVSCNLEQLIKHIVKSHSKSFISRKIRLSLEVEPLRVQSDSKWLAFIINQLITNSLKYTDPQGEIAVTTRTTPDERLLIVRDTGVGIEPRDLPRIFNRGFTGTNGRAQAARSTGMGLYLAQQMSDKLGHYITCVSEPGRFTEMTLHFPRLYDRYRDMVRD